MSACRFTRVTEFKGAIFHCTEPNPPKNFHWSWILTNVGSSSHFRLPYMCNLNLSSLTENSEKNIKGEKTVFTSSALQRNPGFRKTENKESRRYLEKKTPQGYS